MAKVVVLSLRKSSFLKGQKQNMRFGRRLGRLFFVFSTDDLVGRDDDTKSAWIFIPRKDGFSILSVNTTGFSIFLPPFAGFTH